MTCVKFTDEEVKILKAFNFVDEALCELEDLYSTENLQRIFLGFIKAKSDYMRKIGEYKVKQELEEILCMGNNND